MRRFACLFVALLACGGRNLDPPEAEPPERGATGGDDGIGGAGGEGGAVASTTTGGGAGGTGGQGGSPPDPPMPLACLACVGQQCPQTVACVTDPACGQGLFCAFTECLAGGEPDLLCVAECFDGDFGAAADAVSAILCLQGSCGEACGDFFPF